MKVVIKDNSDTRLGHFAKGEVVEMADHHAAHWLKRKAVAKHTPKKAKPKAAPAPAEESDGGE